MIGAERAAAATGEDTKRPEDEEAFVQRDGCTCAAWKGAPCHGRQSDGGPQWRAAAGSLTPSRTNVVTRAWHVGVAIAGQHRKARPFARRVGHDLLPLQQQPEVDDAAEDQQQQRQHERELDEFGAGLRSNDAQEAAPPQVRSHRTRSHSVANAPSAIGSA